MPTYLGRASAILGLQALLASLQACGSHAEEDRKALAEEAKPKDTGEKREQDKGTGNARNLLDRGQANSGASGGGKAGRCPSSLALFTEVEAGRARTVLTGSVDESCAAGLVPVVIITSSGRIGLPPMRCASASGSATTVRCIASLSEVIEGSRFALPVNLDDPNGSDLELEARVEFHDEEEALAALGLNEGTPEEKGLEVGGDRRSGASGE